MLGDIFYFYSKVHCNILLANIGDHDQTPRSAAAALGLHCLPVSNKKDARLIWIKDTTESESVVRLEIATPGPQVKHFYHPLSHCFPDKQIFN